MKRFFARNKKVIEIFLTLLLVCLVAGYYYLIYIPERENEIIARRFRTLQRIEQNMREKMEGYQSTIKNCLIRADEDFFRLIVAGYNTDTNKFHLSILDSGSIVSIPGKDSLYKAIVPSLDSSIFQSSKIQAERRGRKLAITTVKLVPGKNQFNFNIAKYNAGILYIKFVDNNGVTITQQITKLK